MYVSIKLGGEGLGSGTASGQQGADACGHPDEDDGWQCALRVRYSRGVATQPNHNITYEAPLIYIP